MQRQKQYMIDEAKQKEEEEKQAGSRTGDPLKDFELDLKKIQSDEAINYIKLGREATYNFIELLYRTDWKLEKKVRDIGVKIYSLLVPGEGRFYRHETKYENVTTSELIEYFTDIDKRLAWEGQTYEGIEEVKSYPLHTSMLYMKYKKSWAES